MSVTLCFQFFKKINDFPSFLREVPYFPLQFLVMGYTLTLTISGGDMRARGENEVATGWLKLTPARSHVLATSRNQAPSSTNVPQRFFVDGPGPGSENGLSVLCPLPPPVETGPGEKTHSDGV